MGVAMGAWDGHQELKDSRNPTLPQNQGLLTDLLWVAATESFTNQIGSNETTQ